MNNLLQATIYHRQNFREWTFLKRSPHMRNSSILDYLRSGRHLMPRINSRLWHRTRLATWSLTRLPEVKFLSK